MTQNELETEYFDWMYQLVCAKTYCENKSYYNLITYLYNTEFTYSISHDGNRAEDGVELRYRFGYEQEYPRGMITSFLDNKRCSVLEMMVALSVRCEEHIMFDPDKGDRTGTWFWGMVKNIGLLPMDDINFDEPFVDYLIYRFLKRKYGPTGEGGLFTVENPRKDLRQVEIWYQMCWYLDNFI